MIVSMTGYANNVTERVGRRINIELRSVNARYLELHVRLPDELRALEAQVRERLQQRLVRGKVECRITVQDAEGHTTGFAFNSDLFVSLQTAMEQATEQWPTLVPMNVADVLRWPGMLIERTIFVSIDEVSLVLLDETLLAFHASRQEEGQALARFLHVRLDSMQQQLATLAAHLSIVITAYQQKLQRRFAEIAITAGEERIAQELALFAQRVDVEEEHARLIMHMTAMRTVITTGGAVGKRLDFLLQELNREANTLASKSVSIETTHIALELKVLIEQMREQVQNVE